MSASADPDPLHALAWLAGCWRTQSGVSEECWTPPRGGLLLGVHRDVRPNRPTFFEFLRIESSEGTIRYVASPKGQATTAFALVSSTPSRAVFENLAHDFPQRITYERKGEALTATIWGRVGDDERTSSWTFTARPGWTAL